MAELTPIVLSCSPEDAMLHRLQRKITDGDFDFQAVLQELPEDLYDVNDKLKLAEATVVKNADYTIGSALRDDDVAVVRNSGRILLTAEHATNLFARDNAGNITKKAGEKGTGGLAFLLANQTDNDAIVAIGRQTGNATWSHEHPVKKAMKEIVVLPVNEAHLSIHGLATGLSYRPEDYQGYHVLIGIGDNPSEATNTMVYDYLLPAATARGIKAAVNQPFVAFDRKTDMPLINSDGTANTKLFKGPVIGTTAYSQLLAKEMGKADSYIAVQFELSGNIRYQPNLDSYWPNRENRELGIYLGYLFMKMAIESIDKLKVVE